MLRLLLALVFVVFATSTAAQAADRAEVQKLVELLPRAAKLDTALFESYRRHTTASFTLNGLHYRVEYERPWELSVHGKAFTVRESLLVIIVEKDGDRAYQSEVVVDKGADGAVDFASAAHQPPFDRLPPKDYRFVGKHGFCFTRSERCKPTGEQFRAQAQEDFDTLVRKVTVMLETVPP